MDFATVPEALRASGAAGAGAVAALHGADCWGPVSGVAAAVPGGAAAGAAGSYASAWGLLFTGWCETATQHVESLTRSADAYQSTEQRNTAGLPPADGSGGIYGPGMGEIAKALG
jgi:hypothetical protein